MPQIAALLTGGLAGGTPSFLLTLGLGPFSTTPTVTYPDLVAAVLGTLAADAGVATSFGHATSTPKFQSASATATPSLPYLTIEESGGEDQAQTADGTGVVRYDTHAEYVVSVYAASKLQARQLRAAASHALSDADLLNEERDVLYFRPSKAGFPVVSEVAPGAPVVYRASMTFTAILDGTY